MVPDYSQLSASISSSVGLWCRGGIEATDNKKNYNKKNWKTALCY